MKHKLYSESATNIHLTCEVCRLADPNKKLLLYRKPKLFTERHFVHLACEYWRLKRDIKTINGLIGSRETARYLGGYDRNLSTLRGILQKRIQELKKDYKNEIILESL